MTIPTVLLLVRTAYFVSTGIPTSSIIIDVRSSSSENGTTYLPTMQYVYEGATYEVESNAGSGNKDAYKEGEEIELLVNPRNPEDAEINRTWELWAAPIVVGGLTFFVWLAYLALMRDLHKRKKFISRMFKEGIRVDATITKIDTEEISASNSGIRVTKTIFRVYAKGMLNGEEREFKSDRIQVNPRGYGVELGQSVPVYVDPKKPKKTYMDFSHIKFHEDFY